MSPVVEYKKLDRSDYDNIILVVEDDKELQESLIKLINKNFPNCTILTCNNGLDALKMLKKGHAHIVITNWNMKPMSGLNLLKALRFQFTKQSLPIMMLTPKQTKEDLYDFYNNGGNYFLTKPLGDEDFIEKVEKMIILKTMVNMVKDIEELPDKINEIIEIFKKSIITGVAENHFEEEINTKIEDLEKLIGFSNDLLADLKEKEAKASEEQQNK